MSVYNDMAADAGYPHGTAMNIEMARSIEYDEMMAQERAHAEEAAARAAAEAEQRMIAFDTDKEETITQLAALRDVIYESCSAVEQVEMMSFPSLVAQLAIREIQQLREKLGKEKSSI